MDPYEKVIEAAQQTHRVLIDVSVERVKQDDKWGQQNHPDGTGGAQLEDKAKMQRAKTDRLARTGALTWRDILEEEFAEALAESDQTLLREELVQLAAVAVAWVEAIDRRAS